MPEGTLDELDQATGGQPAQSRFPRLTTPSADRSQRLALQQMRLQDSEMMQGKRFEIEAQKAELAKVHEMNALQAEQIRIKDSFEKQRQTAHMMSEIPNLPQDLDGFEKKVAELGSKYPMAASNEAFQKAVSFRYSTLKTQQEYTQRQQALEAAQTARLQVEKDLIAPRAETAGAEEKARKEADSNAAVNKPLLYQKAIAEGQATMGTTTDGKTFTPAKDGTESTHANVSYQDPITGKPVNDILPIEQYNQIKKGATSAPAVQSATKDPNDYLK